MSTNDSHNVATGSRVWADYTRTLPNRRDNVPPRLLAWNSTSNLDYYRTPISPSARSSTSRTRIGVKLTPSPKRKGFKHRAPGAILGAFVKSLKMKRNKKAAFGRSLSKRGSIGQGLGTAERETVGEGQRDMGLDIELNPMENSDEVVLMDDLAQYLMTGRVQNPFKTPPQTPTDPSLEMSPPLSLVDSSPEGIRGQRRARKSQIKSLQILGPEACGAIVEKWKRERTGSLPG